MNALHPVMQAALAPWAPPPAVDRLNDDDAYIVDLRGNCVVRQCSRELARSGISVTLGHAVMTGMQARHHMAYEAERRAQLQTKTNSDATADAQALCQRFYQSQEGGGA